MLFTFLRTLLLAGLIGGLPAGLGYAQGGAVAEYALKSALYFKLPPFVYRPAAASDPLIEMCLLGSNPFGSALEKLAQTPIGSRPAKYIRLGSASEAAECDFVFISRSEAGNLDAILKRLTAYPVVTVSDIEGFAKAGGMVEFMLGEEGAAVTLLINRKAAQRQGIDFSAQLLRLARVVEP
ncbi:MAG: YfiR family protein [Rhodocyclaceae bacterium]|nr:YfiR family protein [Rhodocyclaceae bacterium]